MAKEDTGSVRITVIHFETTSSNETLRQNIKEIANTISRSLTPPVRQSVAQPKQLSPNDVTTIDGYVEDDEIMDEGEVLTEATKPKARANRTVRTPNLIESVNFSSGDVPFKDFYENKGKPDADMKRYLLIMAWLKAYQNLQEITVDHVYTCYRFMGAGWNLAKDPTRAFRNMKAKDWVAKGSTNGSYRLTHIGENQINEMTNE